ncbi:MAG: thiamine pyrophosphate-dependent dehydrogenase E1 component subunit alpha [Proteobacteria bacterium]|nr:thiamine pyrophosphate-dependent dehydrogenase E1 component subunit alpha [Pseudomonadota bacterium]
MSFAREQLITLYTNLVRTRAFDELFVKRLSEGRLLGFYHPAEGGEAPGVGACSFLRPDDYLFPHLRGHGLPHMISKGADPKYYLAEHTGKATGCCGGVSTFHGIDTEFGLMGAAGTVGSCFPVTVGWGLAAKMNKTGQVAVCCFGDGTSNRGTFHECALMANNWKLPVVFVCENNGIGMFVPAAKAHPVEDIASLAQGYGMPGVVADGQDVIAVAEAVQAAVERARAGKGPSMVELKCHRFCSHAVGIPDYRNADLRTPEEIDELRKRDPVRLCREKLLEQGILTPEDVERIDREAEDEVAAAEKFADESPIAEPVGLDELLYAK